MKHLYVVFIAIYSSFPSLSEASIHKSKEQSDLYWLFDECNPATRELGGLEKFKEALAAGANVNAVFNTGETVFINSLYLCDPEHKNASYFLACLETMLPEADLTIRDYYGRTALILAANRNFEATVALILKKPTSNPQYVNAYYKHCCHSFDKRDALYYALERNNVAIARMLFNAGAVYQPKRHQEVFQLCVASKPEKNASLIQLCKEHGAHLPSLSSSSSEESESDHEGDYHSCNEE